MITINGIPLAELGPLEAQDFLEWEPITITCEPITNVQAVTLLLGSSDLGEPSMSPFNPVWRWQWQPRGVAGTVFGEIKILLHDGESQVHSFRIELKPRLLDQETWQALLEDFSRHARHLASRLAGMSFATALLLPRNPGQRSVLEDAVLLLEQHRTTLTRAVQAIGTQPAQRLKHDWMNKSIEEVDSFDGVRIPVPPQVVDLKDKAGVSHMSLPQVVEVSQRQHSYDIPEHRWLVGLIMQLQRRARRVRQWIEQAQNRSTDPQEWATLQRRLEQFLAYLRHIRQEAFLAELKPLYRPPTSSQRLVRDRRYRPLRELWREMQAHPWLALYVEDLGFPLHDLPRLYEHWCTFKVVQLVLDLPGTLIEQRICFEDVEAEVWRCELPINEPLVIKDWGNQRLVVRYQPRYTTEPDAVGIQSLDGYVRIPDIVIERQYGQNIELLVLDAKYRRASNGRVPQAALDDAYAYQGSLGRNGHSVVQQAVVLYPNNGMSELFNHIGAIPVQPGQLEALQQWLQQQLGMDNTEML